MGSRCATINQMAIRHAAKIAAVDDVVLDAVFVEVILLQETPATKLSGAIRSTSFGSCFYKGVDVGW